MLIRAGEFAGCDRRADLLLVAEGGHAGADEQLPGRDGLEEAAVRRGGSQNRYTQRG
jgi:hypothetical protein